MAGAGPIRAVLSDKDGALFDLHRVWVPACRTAARLAAEADAVLDDVSGLPERLSGLDSLPERGMGEQYSMQF